MGNSNNGSKLILPPGVDNPGGSMHEPETFDPDRQVVMTMGEIAEAIENGIKNGSGQMQQMFDAQEKQIAQLEQDNIDLRRQVTALSTPSGDSASA